MQTTSISAVVPEFDLQSCMEHSRDRDSAATSSVQVLTGGDAYGILYRMIANILPLLVSTIIELDNRSSP